MNDAVISYIKANAFINEPIFLDKSLGEIICPKISSLKSKNTNLVYYNYNVLLYTDLHNKYQDDYINELIKSNKINDFANFVLDFYDADEIIFKNNSLHIMKIDDNNKQNVVGILDKNNISFFMDIIKILHFLDNDESDFIPKNEAEKKALEDLKKARARAKQNIKKKDGIGILEILSAVSARHNSINPINIKELNYYQLIDQYIRLRKIDSWKINMDALTNGNLNEEGKKKIEDYTSKTNNS